MIAPMKKQIWNPTFILKVISTFPLLTRLTSNELFSLGMLVHQNKNCKKIQINMNYTVPPKMANSSVIAPVESKLNLLQPFISLLPVLQ